MRNSNGISVIIAHYAPPINTNYYRNILKKTIHSIRSQKVDFDVEIIVCDDGSAWSGSLATKKGITELDESQIKSSDLLNDLDVNRYLLLPDSGKYLGIVLKHHAFEIANYNKIVVLDDDHPFIRNDSLSRYNRTHRNSSIVHI
jgi:cellulose synthase/poly-beta-1,6-N-acetylglucosamine synthase-like glycosyltransferase